MNYISIINYKYYLKSHFIMCISTIKNSCKYILLILLSEMLSLLIYHFSAVEWLTNCFYYIIMIFLILDILYIAYPFLFVPISVSIVYLIHSIERNWEFTFYLTKINDRYITIAEYDRMGHVINTESYNSSYINIYIHKSEIYISLNKKPFQVISKDIILDGFFPEILRYYLLNFANVIKKI